MSKKPTKDAFIAEALLIDTKPTVYNTKFRPQALSQVTDKINTDGLPLLLVHDSSKLPVGAWYEAKIEDESVLTKFYVPKEISEYEDIKTRIDTDILDSVSIGFNAGRHDCSICGNDIQDYETCPHIPGKAYEVKDPESGASLGEDICYVLLDDIKASEASLVYSGAVPAAKIVQTEDKAEFFTQNKLNFSEGTLEIVHEGKFIHNKDENKNERKEMEEEYKVLENKYLELNEKFSTAREEILELKEKNLEFKTKAEEHDIVVKKYNTAVEALKAKVEAIAAPFDTEYKAPDDVGAMLKDLDKFVEEAKALPVGKQSVDEEALAYIEPDDVFKV